MRLASKYFFTDLLLSAINSLVAILKPMAFIYLINNFIGTEAYGQIAVFLSSTAIVSLLSSLGVGFSMTRHISGDVDIYTKKRLFYRPINSQLLFLLIYFFFGYCYVGVGAAELSLTELCIYSFYYLSSILFHYFIEYFRWTLNSSKFVAISAFYGIAFLSTLLGAFKFGLIQNVYQILMLDAVMMFVIFLYLFSTIYKELGLLIGTFDRSWFLKEFRLGMPFAVGGLGEIAMAVADRFMIVYFFGLLQAGLYSSGYMLGSLSLILVRLVGLFLPQHMFAVRDSGDVESANNLLNISIFLILSLSIPYVFFLILFGSTILSFISIDSEQALLSMIFISIGTPFLSCYLTMCSITLMEKKTTFQMKLVVSLTIFNVVVNYILIKIFSSFVVASLVTLITYMLLAAIFFWYLRSIWTFDFPLKFFLIPLYAALMSYCITRLVEGALLPISSDLPVFEVILFLSLYGIVFMCFLIYFKVISVRNILRFN